MLVKTSKKSLTAALELMAKLPFSKSIIHKLSEVARGKGVVFFSLHRVFKNDESLQKHPHGQNGTAISKAQFRAMLSRLNRILGFVSLNESLELLRGHRRLDKSVAVLIIEAPYIETMDVVVPIVEELKIPISVLVTTSGIQTGQMPWHDEVVFRVGNCKRNELSLDFIDRSFPLGTNQERMVAANSIVDTIGQCEPVMWRERMTSLRNRLAGCELLPSSERLCTPRTLARFALNPLISFASAGSDQVVAHGPVPEYAAKEVVEVIVYLKETVGSALSPVFFYPPGFNSRLDKLYLELMGQARLDAAISRKFGICRPGDNMFHLTRIPFVGGKGGFERFELQGLADAIDEFLLVTLAKNKQRNL